MSNDFLPAHEPTPIEENLYFNKDDRVWSVHDSSASKIQRFLDCPRSYFYHYMLGWKRDSSDLHLVFGDAWHMALEFMLQNNLSSKSVGGAYAVFLNEYRKSFPEASDLIPSKYAKKPTDAFSALVYYQNKFSHEANERTLLHTEVAGTVPVSDNVRLHFRLDALFDTPNGKLVQEHKTASKRGSTWVDQWYLKMQTGVYQHVAHMMWPDEEIAGVEVNGMVFYKNETPMHGKQESVRVPINRNKQMMAVWLWNVRHWLKLIEWNIIELDKAIEGDDILSCFPMNTESCTKYFGCDFLPYCQIWANPLRHADEPPPGFKVKWSQPVESAERVKKIVHIGEE